jgi:transcriptional regulator with XRE-family HTH domain
MLGKKIAELRKKQGLSCAELARRCGYAVSTMHGIESGRNRRPSFQSICEIADVLGVEIAIFKEVIHPNENRK